MNQEILKDLGFYKLSNIQKEVLEKFNTDKNIVIVSPTGTGKTHAYLFPLYENMTKGQGLRAIFILPTNDLVFQAQNMTKELFKNFKVRAYYGSMDKKRELEWLNRNEPDIVIGTPSKIKEFIDLNAFKLTNLEYIVFDEADMMFEADFLRYIEPILNVSKNAKLILVSATITEAMKPFIKTYFGNYELIENKEELKITHYLYNLKATSRDERFKDVIKAINPYFAIIFVSKKEDQDYVFNILKNMSLNVGNLSGNQPVKVRRRIMKEAQDLKYQYLVTSDIASRGIDFDSSHIINYDIPRHLEYFFHRSGRTARMGKSGVVITLAADNDHRKVSNLEKKGVRFQKIKVSNGEIIKIKDKKKGLSDEEIKAIRKIRKPKKVKPNYKKKNKAKIEKELKKVRRKKNAKNRKSR